MGVWYLATTTPNAGLTRLIGARRLYRLFEWICDLPIGFIAIRVRTDLRIQRKKGCLAAATVHGLRTRPIDISAIVNSRPFEKTGPFETVNPSGTTDRYLATDPI